MKYVYVIIVFGYSCFSQSVFHRFNKLSRGAAYSIHNKYFICVYDTKRLPLESYLATGLLYEACAEFACKPALDISDQHC